MRNTTFINKDYWDFFNFLRGKMSASSIRVAAVITAEAVEELRDKPDLENEEDVADVMKQIAESIGADRIMYRNSKDAFAGYSMLKRIDCFDWEELLGAIGNDTGELVHIPQVLIEQFMEYFDPETKSVLITEGEKFTPSLREIVNAYPDCDYTITTMNEAYKTIMERVFDGYDNVRIELTSIYEYEFINERFDLIISVPVFGSRLLVDKDQRFMCREHEMVATENLLLHLNQGGRLAIVLPSRITYAGGSVRDLRNFIQQMYKLEEISEMPEGLFTWTSIRTYLFVIATGETDDITIRKYAPGETVAGSGGRAIRSIELEDETFSMLSELEEQGDWNIDRLFASQDEDWQKFMGVKREALREVAEVFRGKNVTKKSPTGRVGVLNISNLKEYTIDYDSLEYIDESERRVMSYILQTGDILIPARGTATRVALFEEQDYPCIASSNLVVIRPRQDLLNSTYLKVFFDSPLGEKLLASAQQGTTVINLSYKDLQNLEVPVPEMAKQQKIADEYNKELEIYLERTKQAEERWNEVISSLREEL